MTPFCLKNEQQRPCLLAVCFFRDNADSVAFACYFNRDRVPSPDLPGHLIGPWTGIENPAIGCARIPLGDVNRCGSRAWRAWMAAAP